MDKPNAILRDRLIAAADYASPLPPKAGHKSEHTRLLKRGREFLLAYDASRDWLVLRGPQETRGTGRMEIDQEGNVFVVGRWSCDGAELLGIALRLFAEAAIPLETAPITA